MNKIPDYYQLLHVQPDAPAPVIKASYRAMMQKMKLHPDLGGDEAQAQELNEAVAVLCNKVKREQYDQQLKSQAHSRPAPGGSPNASSKPQPHTNGEGSEKKQSDAPRKKQSNPYAQSIKPVSLTSATRQCAFCHTAAPAALGNNLGAYRGNKRCVNCNGATTPIDAIDQSFAENLRKIHRHDHHAEVTLWTRWPANNPWAVSMTDLSIAGCALLTAEPIALQTIVMIDAPMLNSISQVRYCQQTGPNRFFSIGLEFVTLDLFASPGTVFSATA